jgi:hypothetical protein
VINRSSVIDLPYSSSMMSDRLISSRKAAGISNLANG